ncbi:hypothetical protein N5C43_07265 [Comamonas terrigena]|uniref:hypothetical protein n=1 Tax=Comamonas terrigena TaxID=32013 RepID=UPI00244A1BA7|nr:hypothetical protein [Comamonas terrigena]MDH1291057.1 hypothetical protein [Comamonas terrigena]
MAILSEVWGKTIATSGPERDQNTGLGFTVKRPTPVQKAQNLQQAALKKRTAQA